MNAIVPRTCTEISAGDEEQHREKESRSLEALRGAPAYVLLGDPGAGKTTAFEAECEALGEKACLITARDFLAFNPQSHPEWHDKTLFIDGLDEIRVGANDVRTPFDQIRRRLDELRKPNFRLSCREADWLGANDRSSLETVSPDSKVTILRLNLLTDSDIADILNARPDIGGAQAFIAFAQERGVYELLKNPQTFEMLADVVAQGRGWPKSRKETFAMACGQMVREPNEEHQAAQESNRPPAPELLAAAGHLCAVQLISGAAGYALRGHSDENYPALDQCAYDRHKMLRPALATKLFKGTSNNHFAPVHRHLAEFLGARHLAKVIDRGLPARRTIALIAGEDGTVVTEMRGLSAWLAAHCKDARGNLIERDPIGVGLYGDIREFSTDEKSALLESLNREASRLGSAFLKTAAFGALATPDMEPVLREILNDSKRNRDHQTFTGFVLDVLTEGGPLPSLSELLLEIVRDDTRCSHVNYAALNAFIHNCPDSQDKTNTLKALWADIQSGRIAASNTQLFKSLLDQQLESAVSEHTSQSGNEGLSAALNAFIHNCPDSHKPNMLKALRADIQSGSASGPSAALNAFIHNCPDSQDKTNIESLLDQQLESAASEHTSQSGNEGLSLEVPREQAHEQVQAILDQLHPSWATPPESLAKEQEEWLNRVRSNETALRENRAPPDLLHRIGFEYFGFFYDFSGDNGLNSIEKWLLGDSGLINAALEGLRGAIDREDVPDVEEILDLKKKGHIHYLGLPFLAGLAEVERTAPEDPSQWDDGQIRKAIAFYYSTPHANYRPQWYRRLLAAHPKIVAEVQVPFATSELRSGHTNIYKLGELAHDPEYARVAQYASLPLLKFFPIRCKLEQIEHLDHLLWAALQYADRSSLQELIKKKLSRTSMNDAQRIHWLAAGVIVSPREYENCLRDFVQVRESRIRHLVAFFGNRVQFPFGVLGTPGLELLIGLLGRYIGPRHSLRDGGSTPILVVYKLIQCLAASPAREASNALPTLLAEPALSRWHDALSQAQDAQRVTRRDASYRHPTIEQVCQTLNGGTPANPGDLAALVMDLLGEIARKIRGGSTSDWRQYWNVDQYNRPRCEKPEEACRDNLLSDLEDKLKHLDIDAQPEGQYADGKRSDIRVCFRDFNVPVEIKKNKHRDLWSALRNQLISQYTSTPDTDGYGIYLVFWFGKDLTPPPLSGTRPADAKELKKRLEATLSPGEARKISVCVIDVSQPN